MTEQLTQKIQYVASLLPAPLNQKKLKATYVFTSR